ncbi:hypothetical protein WMF04_34105 [Sorangium sp. So ce260]|uniref:hypothetical protein n=1 Tax=Sorangium sp. So ce260 TaxID=3133291 RepID=UPI003F63A707
MNTEGARAVEAADPTGHAPGSEGEQVVDEAGPTGRAPGTTGIFCGGPEERDPSQ